MEYNYYNFTRVNKTHNSNGIAKYCLVDYLLSLKEFGKF